MKHIALTSVLIFLISNTVLAEKVVDFLQKRNNLSYEVNSQTPFTGKLVTHYKNGQKEQEIGYKDGIVHKYAFAWFENGQRKFQFEDDKKIIIEWYKNGQKSYEKINNSTTIYYSKIGSIETKKEYKNKIRTSTSYYQSGKIKEKLTIDYNTNDNLSSRTNFYENGQIKSHSQDLKDKDENGNKKSNFKFYTEDGFKYKESKHLDNKTAVLTYWYKNGQKQIENEYKDDYGIQKKWYENGQLQEETNLKKSSFIGPNGERVSIFNKDGLSTIWNRDGTIVGKIMYKNGSIVKKEA